MKGKPALLTVIMPVYNAGNYLREAIESILHQSFKDFEFLIIDDGSTDNSRFIINSFDDARIRVVYHAENKGIAYCRNVGIRLSETEFIAWCDADDICMRDRLAAQLQFLKTRPDIGLCGSWLQRIGKGKHYTGKASGDPEIIKARLLFKPLIFNATSMWRLGIIKKHGLLFDESLPMAEDYDLYSRCAFLFPMSNVQKSLYLYRWSETSILKQYPVESEAFLSIHGPIYKRALVKLGIDATAAELRLHNRIGSEQLFYDMETYTSGFSWLQRIQRQNKEHSVYDQKALNLVLGEEFLFLSKKASKMGMPVFWFYLRHCKRNFHATNFFGTVKLLLRCIVKYRRF